MGKRHRSFNTWPDHICLHREGDIGLVLSKVQILTRTTVDTI